MLNSSKYFRKHAQVRDSFVVKFSSHRLKTLRWNPGYAHTLPIRVCAAQRGRDFEAPDLVRGIHFRGVYYNGV